MSENVEKMEKLFAEISAIYEELTVEEKNEIMKRHNTKAVMKAAKQKVAQAAN